VCCTHTLSRHVRSLVRPYRSTRLGQATTTSTCKLLNHARGRLRLVPFPCTHYPVIL
jgi:hypothetical protein